MSALEKLTASRAAKISKTSSRIQSTDQPGKEQMKKATKVNKDTCTLDQLNEVDKQKVARLVEKLVTLGQEHDNAIQTIQRERELHEEEMKNLTASVEGQFLIIEDQIKLKDEMIFSFQTKEAMLTSMLALYQQKLKNMSEVMKISSASERQSQLKQKKLEEEIDHFSSVIENQRRVILSMEQSKGEQEQSLRSSIAKAEEMARISEVAMLQEKSARVQLEDRLQQVMTEKNQLEANLFALEQKLTSLTLQIQKHQLDSSRKDAPTANITPMDTSKRVERASHTTSAPQTESRKSKDDYTHYSLMYNSSQDEINTSLGSMEGESEGYRRQGVSVATVVDYSPNRPPFSSSRSNNRDDRYSAHYDDNLMAS